MAASFATDLKLGKITYLVNQCHYTLSQPTDTRGRAAAGVRSGLIQITITGDDYQTLAEWGVNPLRALNGTLVYKDDIGATFKTVRFEQGYCVSYEEEFTPHTGLTPSYTFHLGVTAAKMFLNETLHDNMWMDWKPDGDQ